MPADLDTPVLRFLFVRPIRVFAALHALGCPIVGCAAGRVWYCLVDGGVDRLLSHLASLAVVEIHALTGIVGPGEFAALIHDLFERQTLFRSLVGDHVGDRNHAVQAFAACLCE